MSDEGRELMREERKQQQHQGGNPNKGHQQGSGMHNQVVIQNTAGGLVHIGPSYHMQVVQQQPQQGVKKEELDTEPGKLVPPKESVRPLWYSTRVMQADELLRLSKNIGAGWKNVGNGLKFNWAQMEQFEADTRSQGEAIHRMLFRWLQWKDQKATVGRLTKVLFNHREYEALSCLQP